MTKIIVGKGDDKGLVRKKALTELKESLQEDTVSKIKDEAIKKASNLLLYFAVIVIIVAIIFGIAFIALNQNKNPDIVPIKKSALSLIVFESLESKNSCVFEKGIVSKLISDFDNELSVDRHFLSLTTKQSNVAKAFNCAKEQGYSDELKSCLFNQLYDSSCNAISEITFESSLDSCVAKAGLFKDKFDKCYSGTGPTDALNNDIALASTLAVNSDPFIAISFNGINSTLDLTSNEALFIQTCKAINYGIEACNKIDKVKIALVLDASCKTLACRPIKLIELFKQEKINLGIETYYSDSETGKNLMKTFSQNESNFAVIEENSISKYSNTDKLLSFFGAIKESVDLNYFIVRNLPLVQANFVVDSSCKTCGSAEAQVNSMKEQGSVYSVLTSQAFVDFDEKIIELASAEGQAIKRDYALVTVPSLLIDLKSISAYSGAVDFMHSTSFVSLRYDKELINSGKNKYLFNQESCSSTGKLDLQEYSDFLSIKSFDAWNELSTLKSSLSDLNYGFHYFPLNGQPSLRIALAVNCAAKQNKFADYAASAYQKVFKDGLFNSFVQKSSSGSFEIIAGQQFAFDKVLLDTAKENSLNEIDFNSCLNATEIPENILADRTFILEKSLIEAPSFVLDCKYIVSGIDSLKQNICLLHPELDYCK